MAARPTDDLADDELDVAGASEEPDEDFDLVEDELDEDLELADDEPDLDDDPELETDPDEELEPAIDDELGSELEDGVDGVDPDEAEELTLPTFDEEDEDELVRAVVDDDDEGDLDADGLRDGEFVCRACYMAKRESALADPKRMLCRDCA